MSPRVELTSDLLARKGQASTRRLDRERHRRLEVFGARARPTTRQALLEALDARLAACGADRACLRGAADDCART